MLTGRRAAVATSLAAGLLVACGTRTGLLDADLQNAGGSAASGGTSAGGTGGEPEPLTCDGADWARRFGSVQDLESGAAAVSDRDCNVVVTGILRGTADLGQGPIPGGGMFLAKYGPKGSLLWESRLGDDSGNLAVDVALGPDGRIVLVGHLWEPVDFGGGTLSSAGKWDVFVARYEANGKYLWSRRFGDDDYQHATSVAVSKDGSIVVGGYFAGTIDFGGAALVSDGALFDSFVVKLDPGGGHLWSRRIGNADTQTDVYVATGPDGDVWIAGELRGAADFGGGVIESAGGDDGYLARYSADGSHEGSLVFGDSKRQHVRGLAVDHNGYALIAGEFEGTIQLQDSAIESAGGLDAFVAKVGPDFSAQWLRRFGDAADQGAHSVAVGSSGRVAIGGSFDGTLVLGAKTFVSHGLKDVFASTLDSSGVPVASVAFGDAMSQRLARVALDETDALIVLGAFEGTIGLAGATLESAGGTDVFVGRMGAL